MTFTFMLWVPVLDLVQKTSRIGKQEAGAVVEPVPTALVWGPTELCTEVGAGRWRSALRLVLGFPPYCVLLY